MLERGGHQPLSLFGRAWHQLRSAVFPLHTHTPRSESEPGPDLEQQLATPLRWHYGRIHAGHAARRAAHQIFATIFGPSAVPVNRVRPILAGQMANSYTVEQGLALIREGLNVTPSSVLYAIAGAPYIFPSAVPDGGANEVPGLTVDQLVSGLAQGVTIAPMPARTHTVAGRACPPRGTVFAWWRTRAGWDTYVRPVRAIVMKCMNAKGSAWP